MIQHHHRTNAASLPPPHRLSQLFSTFHATIFAFVFSFGGASESPKAGVKPCSRLVCHSSKQPPQAVCPTPSVFLTSSSSSESQTLRLLSPAIMPMYIAQRISASVIRTSAYCCKWRTSAKTKDCYCIATGAHHCCLWSKILGPNFVKKKRKSVERLPVLFFCFLFFLLAPVGFQWLILREQVCW